MPIKKKEKSGIKFTIMKIKRSNISEDKKNLKGIKIEERVGIQNDARYKD